MKNAVDANRFVDDLAGNHHVGRDEVERLLRMTNLLSPPDRALFRGVFDRGLSMRQLALASGTSDGRIRRRILSLLDRMTSPMFRFVASEHSHWPRIRRNVARAVLLEGLTQRDAARKLKTSLYEVRCELQAIRVMFETSSNGSATPVHS